MKIEYFSRTSRRREIRVTRSSRVSFVTCYTLFKLFIGSSDNDRLARDTYIVLAHIVLYSGTHSIGTCRLLYKFIRVYYNIMTCARDCLDAPTFLTIHPVPPPPRSIEIISSEKFLFDIIFFFRFVRRTI